jgi:NAD(P)-dependent dehydrogenase (short-subunit alcohol dehydrogenase family)
MSDLTSRVAVITGGGRGIGAAIARAFAGAGAHVVISGRAEAPLAKIAGELRERGLRADHTTCDVARPEEVARLAETVHRVAGPATIVVNNSGIARSAKLRDTDEDMWREVIETNLGGSYRVTRAFLDDVLAAGRRGRIIFIGSTASKIGFSYTAAYSASKHGVLGLCRSLAHEMAAKGPTVNCVCPGWVETDMAQQAVDNIAARTGRDADSARRELERMSPQRRLMTPEEVAALTLFLAGDGAAAINGQAINVDGGQVMT